MTFVKRLFGIAVFAAIGMGQAITFPGTLSLSSLNSTGTSFAYSGTLTQAATITITASGQVCLQSGGTYCTNGAGIVRVAGSSPVGAFTSFSGTFGGTTATWNFGSVLMSIETVGTVELFAPNAANGLGSGSPPSSVSLSNVSLSSLGFPSFSVTSPEITFIVADNNYPDNSGSFSLSNSNLPTTPIPSTLLLSLGGITLLALWMGSRLLSAKA